jgi:circadian clock protein KaiB
MYKLKLYITGRTPNSRQLIKKLEKMFDRNCGGRYSLVVLDVFEHPEKVYEDAIIATPTLVKTLPEPVRRIVGDLTNEERVLAGLEVVKL